MGIDIFFRRVADINRLIIEEDTGTPDELAETLGVTSRTVYSYIKFMREDLGAPILYDDIIKTYKYKKKGGIPLMFCPEKRIKK